MSREASSHQVRGLPRDESVKSVRGALRPLSRGFLERRGAAQTYPASCSTCKTPRFSWTCPYSSRPSCSKRSRKATESARKPSPRSELPPFGRRRTRALLNAQRAGARARVATLVAASPRPPRARVHGRLRELPRTARSERATGAPDALEIGYTVLPEFRGQGFATEAAQGPRFRRDTTSASRTSLPESYRATRLRSA